MKNIKNMVLSGASVLLAANTFVACIEGNDWDVDSSFDRLFHVSQSSISVTADATFAEVSFNKTPNTTHYVIQISTDSLYDDMDESVANILTYGEDTSITTSPDTIWNLAGDTKYFFRMKGCNASTGKESLWVYLKKSSFKTKAEQIFNEITDADRDETYINVSWDATKTVTHLLVSHNEEVDGESSVVEDRYDLDEAAKTAGTFKITGLKPMTIYTIQICNGDAVRGTLKASTAAPSPDGDYKFKYNEENGTLLDQLKAIAEEAAAEGRTAYRVTAIIPGGTVVDFMGLNESGEAANVKIPDGMAVTFFGGAGEVPTLNCKKCLDLTGTHNYVRFENLNITDGGCQYLVNQSSDCVVEELSFKGCRIYDFDRSLVRGQSCAMVIDKILVDDCILTNMSSGNGYSVFYLGDAKNKVQEISLTNSTFDTAQRSFIEASKTCISTINITNCTLYNLVVDGRYLIDANGQETTINLTSIILGKTNHETAARGVRTAGVVTVLNSIRTSDCIFGSNDFRAEVGFPVGEKSSADIFTDPENHDFTLKIADQIGDPRWFKPE